MTWSPVNYGIRLKAMISKRRQFYKALWKSGQREIQICKERILLLHKLILIDTGDSYFESYHQLVMTLSLLGATY